MKLLHCADIHLGYETHGRIDPETGLNSRLLDFARCFDAMVERALAEDIDLFLFCGDAYRTADPTPTQQKLFAECLKPISDAGIPIVMVIGNHDHPVSHGKASAVDIFSYLQGDVTIVRRPTTFAGDTVIETKSGPLQLVALPWPIRSLILAKDQYRKKSPTEIRELIEDVYLRYIGAACSKLDPTLPAVLAGHFSVHGSELGGSERASLIAHEPKFSVGDLGDLRLDYVALGHIHKYQDRNLDASSTGEGPPVVYSSSIERISFKEADSDKGFVLITIEQDEAGRNGKRTTYEFVDTPARRFVSVDANFTDADSPAGTPAAQADPTAYLLGRIKLAHLDEAVVRVRYRIDDAQASLVDHTLLREALAPANTIAAIERIVDPSTRERRTTVRRDASLKDALEQYIAQHDTLTKLKADLVEAALKLEQEL